MVLLRVARLAGLGCEALCQKEGDGYSTSECLEMSIENVHNSSVDTPEFPCEVFAQAVDTPVNSHVRSLHRHVRTLPHVIMSCLL